MQKFVTVAKQDADSIKIMKDIQKYLFNNGLSYSESEPDLVVVIGGDGTFLSAVHMYMKKLDKVIFTGVNTGTLGFFSDYTVEDLQELLENISHRQPQIEERKLLKITLRGENSRVYLAVNEMRIENASKTQAIDVFIDGEQLETFRGTGLCVATSTGSTAYNRSLSGAVVEKDLEVMEMTEIAGIHHMHYRSLGVPLVLDGRRKIRLEGEFDESALMCFDRYTVNLKGIRSVECTLAAQTYRLAHYKPTEYIHHLYHLF